MKFKINTKKLLKRLAVTLGVILGSIIALILSLRIPAVQNYVKDKLVVYLEEKIQTRVSLEKVYIAFPNRVIMQNLYLQGQDVDTLLAVRDFDVGLNMWKLLDSKADFTSIDLEGVRANVVREADGTFNFDYILDAFATEEKEEASKPFVISLNRIKLRDIGIKFTDHQSRNDIRFHFNEFETRVKTFDLQTNEYAVNRIEMDGLKLKLHQDIVKEVAENVEETVGSLNRKNPLKIDLNRIRLTNFDIDYADANTRTFAKAVFRELDVKINELNLENNSYDLASLIISGADIRADLHLATDENQNEENPENSANAAKPLGLNLDRLTLENINLIYNNTAVSPAGKGIDFNHLDFSELNLNVRDFSMADNRFKGEVRSAEIKEKSGLHIEEFRTQFLYGAQQAYLKNLWLKTPRTVLRDEIVLTYRSVEQLTGDLGNVSVFADIRNSRIAFSDILTLVPSLRTTPPFNQYPRSFIDLDTEIEGTVNDLLIPNLKVSGLDRLKIDANGRIRNLTDPDNLYYNLNISELSSSAQTIFNLVPRGTIPSNISLPSFFTIRGKAKGTTRLIDADLILTSTLGNADILANLDMRRKNREVYGLEANLRDFRIGEILQNPDLGAVSAQISAHGKSFDFADAEAELNANVDYVDYNAYRYRNLDLTGNISRGNYHIELVSQDPGADLMLLASGVYDENNPSLKVNGNIRKLDLNALGFYADPMIIAGNIDADFTGLNPDQPNGYLRLHNFAVSDTEEVFPVQDLTLIAYSGTDSTRITLESQVADLELSGKYKPTQIFGALQQTLNRYYEFQPSDSLMEVDSGQYFNLNARIKNDDLIRKFLPELKSFETITLTGSFDTDSRRIELDGQIPRIQYGDFSVENTSLKITNENRALQYNLDVASFGNENFALNRLNLSGNVADNVIRYRLTSGDEEDREEFLIAGNMESIDEITQISLDPDGLKLNYTDWAVAENNRIRFDPDGIFAENFRISHNTSEISIQSENENPGSPLNFTFRNFEIQTLTEWVRKDSLLAQGTVNGGVQIRNFTENPVFETDLTIDNLAVFGNPVGDLAVHLDNHSADLLNADIRLTGNDNDLQITGTYATESGDLSLNTDINRLQMKSVQGLSMNAITDAQGFLSGNLKISGTPQAPVILGSLKFNDVGLMVAQTGSDFRNINDEIDFTRRGLEFDNFKINDKDGNSLNIDGEVLTKDYTDFAFNLNLNARDFKVVNSEESNEAIMYGILSIDADLHVGGNLNMPVVDGNIAVSDDTDFTFVLPQSSPTLQERDGIVEFIDKDQPVLNETITEEEFSSQSDFKGMDVSVNIEVDKEAKMSIIIDKANGDFIELQGEAELTGGIDPSGKTTLVGVYQVEEGGYELSVSMLKRRFDIQKGSTITWTGEPTAASLDITAVYTTEAAPIDLLEQQLSGLPPSEMNRYKQRIPFHTLLKLQGELLKPEITFDITTDENNASVASSVLDNTRAKLAQLRTEEAEMNKQVFALLLLNRFVGENPFESNSGLSAETIARQSVSKILSQQLNNLTSDLISGVDLNFNLESTEDYSMGEKNTRTDLNVEVSKRLLNDRLKVSVGSNFELEGEARQNEQTTNIAGDVAIDYNLSRDGRYMLRAYRKNEYQVALQGQIVETGVGFIITLDYDKFRDIFRKTKKSKNEKE